MSDLEDGHDILCRAAPKRGALDFVEHIAFLDLAAAVRNAAWLHRSAAECDKVTVQSTTSPIFTAPKIADPSTDCRQDLIA
eukprot:1907611-Rhodomonas_salina.1